MTPAQRSAALGLYPPPRRTPIDRPLVKWRAKPLTRWGVGRFTVVSLRASCLSLLLVAHRWPMRTRHPSGSGTDRSPGTERQHRPSAHL